MLEEWPTRKTNLHWIEKSAQGHGNPTQGENFDQHEHFVFHVGLGSANEDLNLTSLSLERVVVGTHPCNFYEVWIASFCYVTEASTPRKNSEEANYNVLMTIDTWWLFERS